MNNTEYPGIDYGLGETNVDAETGIRFGVISMNELAGWAWDHFEADYGEPTCPECSGPAADYDDDGLEGDEVDGYTPRKAHSCCDYVCQGCELILSSDEVTREEPIGHKLAGYSAEEGGYEGFVDSHNDLILTKSRYFTFAQFCSPCVPGAGSLSNPCFSREQVRFPRSRKARVRRKWAKREENYGMVPRGARTYCLGPEFFEKGSTPYPAYRVSDGVRVFA